MRGAIFGDLLTLRLEVRGAAGLVCDIPIRDAPLLRQQPVPVFARTAQSPGALALNLDYIAAPLACIVLALGG